jgi:hypothetical protein
MGPAAKGHCFQEGANLKHMIPTDIEFSGTAETAILPLTIVLLILASAFILTLPKKYAALPFLLAALTIPLGQVIMVAELHLHALRLLILSGIARLIISRIFFSPQKSDFKINAIDRTVILWSIVTSIAFTLLHLSGQSLINRMGFLYNTIGGYFLLRYFIEKQEDVDRVVKCLSLFCIFAAAFMVFEQMTGQNVFGVFGGVPSITGIREGKLRSQGPFTHPIIAGTVGAMLVPLFVGLWWRENSKKYAIIGSIGATVMAITSSSATPLMALIAGGIAFVLWPVRTKMQLIRWGLVLALIGLHLIMKAPVWALIGRIELVSGSSGSHRFDLVDRTILHFWDWWLIGAKDLESWGYLMHDTANEYVSQAVTGGILGLALFITILARCFGRIGIARKAVEGDSKLERIYWSLGACLFANIMAFFGITYFDQSVICWYAVIAMICASTLPVQKVSSQPGFTSESLAKVR